MTGRRDRHGSPRRGAALVAILVAVPLTGCLGDGTRPAEPPAALDELAQRCATGCWSDVQSKPWWEFEPSIAVNPTNPENLIVGIHDDPIGASPTWVGDPDTGEVPEDPVLGQRLWGGPGERLLGAAVSFDAGATWSHRFLPYLGTAEPGSAWNQFCRGADPVTFFGSDGTAYFVAMAAGCGNLFARHAAVILTKSTDGGITWSEPSIVWSTPGISQIVDKPWAAIDPTTGNIAVTWTGFTGLVASADLYVSVSTDDGATWSTPPLLVSRGGMAVADERAPVYDEPLTAQSAMPAWGPDGALHVAYMACALTCTKVATTVDGGASWETAEAGPIDWADRSGGQDVFLPYPTLKVDRSGGPHDGRVYLVHQTAGDVDYDVALRWSDDQGTTWDGPVLLNDNPVDDGTDQFHPGFDVDQDGVLHAIFYDRRNDPDNLLIQTTYARYDPITGAVSNVHLEEPWHPDPSGTGGRQYGHYITVSAAGGTVAMAWDVVTLPKDDQEPHSRGRGFDRDIRGAVLGVGPGPSFT